MTGAVLWTRSLPPGELNDRPAVDNHGTVYVIFGSAVKTHYSSSSSPSSSASSVAVAAAAAGDGDNVPPALTFHAVDAETGAVRWSNNVSGAYSSPVAAGGVVYVATGEGALAAVNASNGHLKWSVPGVTNTWAGPAVDGGLAFGVTESGTLTAVDASTGDCVGNARLKGTTRSHPWLQEEKCTWPARSTLCTLSTRPPARLHGMRRTCAPTTCGLFLLLPTVPCTWGPTQTARFTS